MDNEKAKDRRELIAFKVGDQEFCVDIMNVREIRGWTVTTPIPHAPPYVVGVINLRGTVPSGARSRRPAGQRPGHAIAPPRHHRGAG